MLLGDAKRVMHDDHVADSLTMVHEANDWEDGYFRIHGKYRQFSHCQVYQEVGFSESEIKEIHGHRRERAAGAEGSHFRKLFRRDLHGTLLANLQKIGLLTERMRPRLESVGIRVPALA